MDEVRMPDDLTGSEIAIVGMACRFPGANDLESYWRNLRDGVESISRLSDADLLAAGVTPAELADPNYVKSAPVLEQIEAFDAGFFGYSAVEAEITDPQQRLLLEVAWEALEHAGYNPETYPRAIGAYVGAKTNTYLFHLASRREVLQSLDFFQIVLGGDLAMLSTRLSYKFDLKGPSYAVQTACSTSLVAVHLACQSLLIDECQMALAGAVAINVPHQVGYLHRAGDILSPDGHCRPFDADAGGTLFGSGAGVVVLKRLEDALRDGDTVYAVIRGSATNNDGANKATFTAPSVDGQTSVVLEALAAADLDADTISYVEAHGTGTALGDPIEIFALSEAYRASTDRRQFCALGSVKSNLGHLDAAAGMSGLLKTVLALRHGQIPPSLHFQRPNPRIDFASSPFFVNTALRPWTKGETPRRAGVSSFGFGGTNAHLILEEAPEQAASGPARPSMLLPLSARSPAALEQATRNLAAHLRAHPEQPLADVAYTLQVGRKAFDERRILVARDRDEALAALETLDPQRVFSAGVRADNRPVAFMFPGQGAQYAGMARDLYGHEAVFREAVDRCATLLRPLLGLDIRPLIFEEPERESTKDTKDTNGSGYDNATLKTQHSKLTETRLAQPALFAVEYALALLWQSWGVKPSALIGHSIGEYVAATLAGVFRLEDALALVAARGRLMQALPAGAMLSVQLPEAELLPLLGDGLNLAAVNGPRACVAAGPEEAIVALEGQLAARDIPYRRLHTSHAFHSAMMDPVVGAFEAEVARVQRQAPQLPLVSNRTGTWITAEQAADPRYWAEHLRHAVRFADGLDTLLRETAALLLEVGPGTTLSTFARQIAPEATALASLRHPNDGRPDLAFALTTLGRLWLAGAPLEWQTLSQGQRRQRVALPTYPFERQRHWIDITPAVADAPAQRANTRTGLEDWFYRPTWRPTPLDAGPAPAPEGWLLLADDRGLAAGLAERLLAAGHSVTTVRAGGRFRADRPDAYTLDPRQPDDYRRLVAALWQNQPPRRIVHCWGLGAAGGAPLSNAELAAGQQRGFYSLLFLTRALAAQGLDGPLDLDVVASQTQAVGPQDIPEPARAMALGLCRVIPQEYPQITCRSIDLDLHAPDAPDVGQQAELLLAELLARSGERALAYRAGQRLAQRFERFQPPALEQAAGRLRQGGVYLITGGLGNLGLTLATELARRVQARLVLLGRSALPERANWGSWLETHTADDPTSRRLRAILQIEELGGEVLALSADVTDEAAMADAVAQAASRFGALHGVIHAAGSARGSAFRAIRETGVAESLEHFAPKVLALLVLERVLRGRTLDLVALQSSLSVALGGLGNAAYAAANTFMDAFAVRQQRAGQPWVSIDWDSWHQPGEVAGGIGTTLVDLTIGPDEGAAAFVRLLAAPPGAPALVSTGDLQTRLDQWVFLKGLQDQGAPAAPGGSLPERGELTRRLAAIWQRVLDLPRVDLDANFFDLGGNSLSGMQLISELKRELNVQLAPVALFEAPSIRALAELLSPKEAETLPAATPAPAPAPASGVGPVAIVGMAGRFPGAESVEQFWQNLRDGVESIRFFGDEELGAAGIPPALLRDPRYVKARPVLGAVDGFDAAFFGYTPREAALMDPQHRLFMEVSWEALEQAGYAGPDYAGTVGIFGGASISTYLLNLYANPAFVASIDPLQTIIGNDKDSLTTSVSYKLNLKGPSLAVQTFCSTSLVAVHLASQSLQRGECSVALAGGVSVVVPQQSGYHYQEEGIVSPDGHCRPFDARAAGTLFGNGAGVVVLRRLEDALADGDTIYAVVKGSAINNDGSLKAGYTAPSVDGQA
ncbi:MAG TPA: type I polyketide synthase, partial [Roseiflexaceae bacterium]|nr:type I polyketide synthase [Roseiflexaceae bacterium]